MNTGLFRSLHKPMTWDEHCTTSKQTKTRIPYSFHCAWGLQRLRKVKLCFVSEDLWGGVATYSIWEEGVLLWAAGAERGVTEGGRAPGPAPSSPPGPAQPPPGPQLCSSWLWQGSALRTLSVQLWREWGESESALAGPLTGPQQLQV